MVNIIFVSFFWRLSRGRHVVSDTVVLCQGMVGDIIGSLGVTHILILAINRLQISLYNLCTYECTHTSSSSLIYIYVYTDLNVCNISLSLSCGLKSIGLKTFSLSPTWRSKAHRLPALGFRA